LAKGSGPSKVTDHDQVFSIHTWRFNFAFAVDEKGEGSSLRDDRKLKLFGELEAPTKGKLSEIWIDAKYGLIPSGAMQASGSVVGAYAWVQSIPVAILWMPADVVPAILQMVSTRRYRSLTLNKVFSDDGSPVVSRYAFTDEGPRIL